MVYQYIVTLQNKNRKLIDTFSLLLILASSLLFLGQYFIASDKPLILLIGALVLMGISSFNAYQSIKLQQPVHYNFLLLMAALVWFTMPFYPWLGALFLVLGLIEKQAKKNLEIGFHYNQIVFNSFPRKQYAWKDFSNIVLKDNLLTLDFANNKLFQRETIDEEGDAEEEEFNAYCSKQLAGSSEP
jgi:hypothetical protein